MLVSPFTFFRGAAYSMAADLADLPRTRLLAQLCGDAHLSNFGVFAAPDRRMTFSVNDFDETLPGPFEWDVKRLVASFAVAGRELGYTARQRESVNLVVIRSYREAMRTFAGMRTLDLWYARLDVEDIGPRLAAEVSSAAVRRFQRGLARARTKDSLKAFSELTELVDGEVRIASDPPTVVPVEEVAGADAGRVSDAVHGILRSYRQTLEGDRRHLLERFRYVHAARKVVGVGSVGTRAWIILLLGGDEGDPLFLQMKEAEPSVLEPFLGRSRFAKQGQRVVEGQRLMQAASDILLWDQKGGVQVESMSPRTMRFYAQLCGWTLAKAHARSGDAIAIGSYLGASDAFDSALASFAETYADQNERDYAVFKQAVKKGQLQARTVL